MTLDKRIISGLVPTTVSTFSLVFFISFPGQVHLSDCPLLTVKLVQKKYPDQPDHIIH